MTTQDPHPDWNKIFTDEEDILINFWKFLMEKEFEVSKTMAERFANVATSLKGGYNLKDNLPDVKSPIGDFLFSKAADHTIVSMKNALDSLDSNISLLQNYLKSIGRAFLKRQITNIHSLTLEALTPNPFLIRALNLHDYKEALEFVTVSRISRSIVTSFGFFFEDLLTVSGAVKEAKGFDIRKTVGEVVYLIQVKSGTNDINKDQITHWKDLIQKAEKKEGVKGYIGMPYGTRESSTVSINLLKQYYPDGFKNNTLIGTELWEFISGIDNFHEIILEELRNAALKVMGSSTIMDNIREKINNLINEFEKIYGANDDALSRYINGQF